MLQCDRNETFTQALINRYDSDVDDDQDDGVKDSRISNLEKSLMKQEKIMLDLKRRMKK